MRGPRPAATRTQARAPDRASAQSREPSSAAVEWTVRRNIYSAVDTVRHTGQCAEARTVPSRASAAARPLRALERVAVVLLAVATHCTALQAQHIVLCCKRCCSALQHLTGRLCPDESLATSLMCSRSLNCATIWNERQRLLSSNRCRTDREFSELRNDEQWHCAMAQR